MAQHIRAAKQVEVVATSTSTPPQIKYFFPPEIEGESAIVYDPDEKSVIYQKNGDTKRALASITKLMTAMISYEYLKEHPNTTVTITRRDLDTLGDSGLVEGEVWKLKDLINFTLVTSSNDGAVALAHSLMPYSEFLGQMNQKAKDLGSTMSFRDPAGLDNPTETIAGATGTAHDVALLVAEALKNDPEIFDATDLPEYTFRSKSGIVHKAVNTNKAIAGLPHLMGGKTGFTDLAGGNLAVIVNISLNKPIIIVVLGSSVSGRFVDIQALASSTLEYFGS